MIVFFTNKPLIPLIMAALSLLLPTLVALVSHTLGIQMIASLRSPDLHITASRVNSLFVEKPIFSRDPTTKNILEFDSYIHSTKAAFI